MPTSIRPNCCSAPATWRKAAPGIWTWLPLGLRVLNKIENVVREEMDRIGAQEVHLL